MIILAGTETAEEKKTPTATASVTRHGIETRIAPVMTVAGATITTAMRRTTGATVPIAGIVAMMIGTMARMTSKSRIAG
jgi:hypothetical protein